MACAMLLDWRDRSVRGFGRDQTYIHTPWGHRYARMGTALVGGPIVISVLQHEKPAVEG